MNYKTPRVIRWLDYLTEWLPRLGTAVGIVFFFFIVFRLCVALANAQWGEATFWATIWCAMKLDAIKEKL